MGPRSHRINVPLQRHTRECSLCACTKEGPWEDTARKRLSASQEERPPQKLALSDFDLGHLASRIVRK